VTGGSEVSLHKMNTENFHRQRGLRSPPPKKNITVFKTNVICEIES
jgi:hypothetical protein